MTAPHVDLHSLGHLAKQSDNPKMQAILQWVGLGSVIVMGLGAAVHLIRDLTKPHHEWQPEPYPREKHRETVDDLDRHHRRNRGHER